MAAPSVLRKRTTAPRWPAAGLRVTLTLNSSITTLALFACAGTATEIRAGDDAVAVLPALASVDSATIQSSNASSGSRQIETRPMENGRLMTTRSAGAVALDPDVIESQSPPGAA